MFRKIPALFIIASLAVISCTTTVEPEPEVKPQPVQQPIPKPEPKSEQAPGAGNPKGRVLPDGNEDSGEPEAVESPVLQQELLWTEPEHRDISRSWPAVEAEVVFKEIAVKTEPEVEQPPAEAPHVEDPPVQSEQKSGSKSFLELMFSPDAVRAEEAAEMSASAVPEEKPAVSAVHEAEAEPEAEEPVAIEYYTATVREIFVAEIQGEGWILDEYKAEESGMDDMLKYSGREYLYGKTFFKFFPYSSGRFLIKIRKPDYSTGLNERKDLVVTVNESCGGDAEAEYEEPAAGDSIDRKSTAEFSDDTDTPERNAQDDGASEETAMNADRLKETVEILVASGDCSGAAARIESGIKNISRSELDWFYFTLAGLYEKCPGIRDERTAVEYYRRVVDYYPISNYWLESRERIIYLERNFIYIR